mgnify:CR=1 FL=1
MQTLVCEIGVAVNKCIQEQVKRGASTVTEVGMLKRRVEFGERAMRRRNWVSSRRK